MTATTLLTVYEGVAKALSLIEARDYVSFAELGREIPNFTAGNDEDGYIIGIGDALWWLATGFGWNVHLKLHGRVAFHPSTSLVYLIDGGLPISVKEPSRFVPVTMRPQRFTDFVSENGLAWSFGSDKTMWAKLKRTCGKAGLAEGKRKARKLVESLADSSRKGPIK